ncbi:nucleoside triphosphate hydrolase [Mesorhizobium sp. BAC0120]|uniref:nucleoside triphosphate hydrolase n=1 Tax=Mesorhizobium sp. BAC0120 TaxID=3090670 RepID=UPI00298CFADB|nr:nucleoside triphosphate hydrolase [Mesorhizobium sp. BAC0120]MDW6024624.1 nucleoside triphosphate hydrolase [Mesorhizobium sp. BAC0120]
MSAIASVAAAIFKHAGKSKRAIIAVAGPPGAGKSTITEKLLDLLPEGSAAVVPMDGFHYDDVVLKAKGLSKRKGAPETFDFDGYTTLLARLRSADRDVAIPIFDRANELSRAAAAIVGQHVKFVLTEGNYLLLDEEPWSRLGPLLDFTIFLDVPREELERRLIQRWLDHGRTPEDGRNWVNTNDLPNVDRVLARRREADLVVSNGGVAD